MSKTFVCKKYTTACTTEPIAKAKWYKTRRSLSFGQILLSKAVTNAIANLINGKEIPGLFEKEGDKNM